MNKDLDPKTHEKFLDYLEANYSPIGAFNSCLTYIQTFIKTLEASEQKSAAYTFKKTAIKLLRDL